MMNNNLIHKPETAGISKMKMNRVEKMLLE